MDFFVGSWAVHVGELFGVLRIQENKHHCELYFTHHSTVILHDFPVHKLHS